MVESKQDDESDYRRYDYYGICDVLTTNFYQETDIEIKRIQEIRKSKSTEGIE
ncbi:hypothetical protein [Anaerocolumna jejuensis]|uniref:hypothetical protein n=1 Tax=Anaerocolumna jejuensis TaxID=259063 RepID=UPI003F7BD1F1